MGAFLTQAFNASAKIGLSWVLSLLLSTAAFGQQVPARDNIIVKSCPPAAMGLSAS
jgi:hypothetical protein